MNRLFPKFRKFILDNRLLCHEQGIVISVSGGVDSMVMLGLLVRLSRNLDLKLTVAHINHNLRGKESDGDEALVRKAADAYGIECDVIHRIPRAGKNLQDDARRIRSEFLITSAMNRKAQAICLGHNRGDQAETILMHMLRGAGLSGLRGIKAISRLKDMKIVRPLLFASRDEIVHYAKEQGIQFREDSTNAKTAYRRNEIRHRILPELRELNPRIEENLATMGERLGDDEDTLQSIANTSLEEALIAENTESISIDRLEYNSMPSAIRRRLLRSMYSRLLGSSADLNSDQIERMDHIAISGKKAGEYRLKSPWRFERTGDRLEIAKSPARRTVSKRKSR